MKANKREYGFIPVVRKRPGGQTARPSRNKQRRNRPATCRSGRTHISTAAADMENCEKKFPKTESLKTIRCQTGIVAIRIREQQQKTSSTYVAPSTASQNAAMNLRFLDLTKKYHQHDSGDECKQQVPDRFLPKNAVHVYILPRKVWGYPMAVSRLG